MAGLKKVLFVTYYWPPAGGATIARILKFYKYLPEFGWEPVILTVKKGDFPFIDPNLQKEVRPETEVFATKNISMHRMMSRMMRNPGDMFVPFAFTEKTPKGWKGRLSRWVKYNAIPDTRFLWKRYAVKKGLQIIREHQIDLIFSSSPPQTNHCIAAKLSRLSGVPCVGDLRDPWTDVYWLKTNPLRWKCIQKRDVKIERRTLNSMQAITTVSPSWVKLFSAKTQTPVHLVYNGFEPIERTSVSQNEQFTITYAGSISIEQDISTFCKALEIVGQNIDIQKDIKIQFIGNYPDFVKEQLQSFSFKNTVSFLPYMPASDVQQYLVSADLLLLFVHLTPDNGAINYKLYDYLATGKTILGYGPVDGDAADILHQSGSGKMFGYGDEIASAKFIAECMLHKKSGNIQVVQNHEFVNQFTRKNQTAVLAGVFNDLMNKNVPNRSTKE